MVIVKSIVKVLPTQAGRETNWQPQITSEKYVFLVQLLSGCNILFAVTRWKWGLYVAVLRHYPISKMNMVTFSLHPTFSNFTWLVCKRLKSEIKRKILLYFLCDQWKDLQFFTYHYSPSKKSIVRFPICCKTKWWWYWSHVCVDLFIAEC